MRNVHTPTLRVTEPTTWALLLCAAVFLAAPAGSAQGSLLWEDRVDGLEDFSADARAVAAKGKLVIVAGRTTVSGGAEGGQNDAWLVRAHDARNGALIWEDVFDFGPFDDEVDAIALQGKRVVVGGSVIVSEPSAEGIFVTHTDWYVRAYDARNGTLLWQDQVGDTGFDNVRSMAIKGHDVYISGHMNPSGGSEGGGGQDWLVRAHDIRDGALLWENLFASAGFDRTEDAPLQIIGRRLAVVGLGASPDEGGNSDWLVRVLDRRDGDLLWEDQIDGTASSFDNADDAAARGGKIFVAGTVSDLLGGGNEGAGQDGLLRAYRARNGDLLWEQQIDRSGGGFDDLDEVVVQGGRVIVGGEFDNFPPNLEGDPFLDAMIQAYRAGNGAPIWETIIDGGANDDIDAMVVHRGVVVTVGEVTPFDTEGKLGDDDWQVHAVRVKDGAVVFNRLVDDASENDSVEDGFSLAASGRRLFVVGELDNGEDFDWLVQALDLKN